MCIEEIGIEKPTGWVCQYWGRLGCAGARLSRFIVSLMCMSLNFCIAVIRPAVPQVLLSKRMAFSCGVPSGSLARRLIFILPWEVVASISEDDEEAFVVESSSEG
jgi:hypothetical protein